jgi:hypothetical protein
MISLVHEIDPVEDDNEDCSSYADLNMIYSDLYNFKMCEFCLMPVLGDSDYCSDACQQAVRSK